MKELEEAKVAEDISKRKRSRGSVSEVSLPDTSGTFKQVYVVSYFSVYIFPYLSTNRRIPLIRYDFIGIDKGMQSSDKQVQDEIKEQEKKLEKKWFSFMDRYKEGNSR